ncbi:MAG: hypothetical protein ACRETW_08115 [Stenotrophobium sp.]
MGALLDQLSSAGRNTVWVEYTAYAATLLANGSVPWLDSAGFLAWQRKAQGLLKSDVIALSVAPFCEVWLQANPALREAMTAKRRVVFPLKTLLADEGLRAHLVEALKGVRGIFPKLPLALAIPSPRSWIAVAHAQAGGVTEAISIGADEVESAAMFAADFLRAFGDCDVDALLLEEAPEMEPADADEIEWYRPLLNICAHYRWDFGLRLPLAARDPGSVDGLGFIIAPRALSGAVAGVAVPEEFWSNGVVPEHPPNGFRYASIPSDAKPEAVLERLAALR